MTAVHLRSLDEARRALGDLHSSGATIGSVHTLGALHVAHAKVIALAAAENDATVVSIYPNPAQLAPGSEYVYDLEADAEVAFRHGATHVISPRAGEMFPPDYVTFLDQDPLTHRLDATVVPYLFRGMITQCVRWMCFVRPTRCYWGLKDVGQTLLVRRAVRDLMLDVEIREVPCVRAPDGMPISSRLLRLDADARSEVAAIFGVLEVGRRAIAAGEKSAAVVEATMREAMSAIPLRSFRELAIHVVDPATFAPPAELSVPVIVQVIVTDGTVNHFDSLLIRSRDDLEVGPEMMWLGPDEVIG